MKLKSILPLSILLTTLTFFTGCKSSEDTTDVINIANQVGFVPVVNGSGLIADIDFLNGVVDGDNRYLVDIDATTWQPLYNESWFQVDWVIPATDAYGNIVDYRVHREFPADTTSAFLICELTETTPYPNALWDISEQDSATGKRTNVVFSNLTSIPMPSYDLTIVQGASTFTYTVPEIPACTKFITNELNDIDFSTITEILINGINVDMNAFPTMVKDNIAILSNLDFSVVQVNDFQIDFLPLLKPSMLD